MENRQYSSWKILHLHDALDNIEAGRRQAPVYIRIKPTNRCIHNCQYCAYGQGAPENTNANRDSINSQDQIADEKLREIMSDMVQMGVKAVTFSGGGEPLCHPAITDAVRIAVDGGMDLSLITNGQLLKGDLARLFTRAKWIRVSIDSPDAHLYAKLRRVPIETFDEVCANVSAFAKAKNPDCILGVNYVVGRENFDRVYDAAALMKKLGADNIKFSPMHLNQNNYQDSFKDKVIQQIEKAECELSDNTFSIVNKYREECERMDFSQPEMDRCYTCELTAAIGADCKVYLCQTRAYEAAAVLCDLRNVSLHDGWFSPEAVAKVAALSPRRDCRSVCVYEEKNRMLAQYFNVDRSHINFI